MYIYIYICELKWRPRVTLGIYRGGESGGSYYCLYRVIYMLSNRPIGMYTASPQRVFQN